MRRFFKNILLFIAFCVPTYLVLIILSGQFFPSYLVKNLKYKLGSGDYSYTRLKEADTLGKTDILVVGSSHAYRGYDPRLFKKRGYSMFNLGSSAQTFLQTDLLLSRYLDDIDPDLVIFDVYPYLFHLDGVESSLQLVANTEVGLDFLQLAIKQKNAILLNTFIFSWFSQVYNRDQNFKERIDPYNKYISGGFIENFTSLDTMSNKSSLTLRKGSITMDRLQKDAFNSILKTLKEKEIKFVLIQTPITDEQYEALDNIGEFDKLLNEQGVYLNFNKVLDLDHRHFKDYGHLNQEGVEVFNERLLDTLGALHFLTRQ